MGTTSPGDLRGHSLLAVFAHPDDESLASGGLLAWCAARGVRVSLLCLTHGELGMTSGPTEVGSLQKIRARELYSAAQILGVDDVLILNNRDGMLPWMDTERFRASILDAIIRLNPDVVITFGEDGLYWHPDHIAVHEQTTAAVAVLADRPPALYYVTIPDGLMPAIVKHAESVAARRDSLTSPPRSILGINNVNAFGSLSTPPTLVVDTGKFAVLKLRALHCHRSQLHNCALTLVEESDAPRLLGLEHYRRSKIGADEKTFLEQFGSEVSVVNDRSTNI